MSNTYLNIGKIYRYNRYVQFFWIIDNFTYI